MFIKYPRTPHLEGSRLQPGDTGSDQVPVSSLDDGVLVWEEKVDGANTGISFTAAGDIQLQSRGHVLSGGSREGQFSLFKQWANAIADDMYIILGDQYIMYGEWCYAKHSVFYDMLPHYFLEFDIYDKINNFWLDTESRHSLLKDLPIVSVPVVHKGNIKNNKEIAKLIKPSLFKSADWKENLRIQAERHNIDPDQAVKETEKSHLSEGLYIKQEKDGKVIGRYKYVRYDFVQTILDSGTHWADRPILPNLLEAGKNIFG